MNSEPKRYPPLLPVDPYWYAAYEDYQEASPWWPTVQPGSAEEQVWFELNFPYLRKAHQIEWAPSRAAKKGRPTWT